MMLGEKSTRLARTWFEGLWSKGDLQIADEIVHPQYAPEWIHIDKQGPEQVKHEVRYFRSIFPDLDYQIVEMIAVEGKVWVRYKARGTQQGNAWGFEPTGKQVEFEGVTILSIDGDKICDRWGAFCMYDIFEGLELVPPWWELAQYRFEKKEE
jgi:predicted ester cyclase